ncbi:MAG: hypothetical protein WBV94_26815 [Blastocatellia bacterium]
MDYPQLAADFASIYWAEYQLVELTATVADRARVLLGHHALRVYDGIQLASDVITREALQGGDLSEHQRYS